MKNKNENRLVSKEEEALKEQLGAMTFRQKISYFWTYYKTPVLIGIAVVLILGSVAYQIFSPKKEIALASTIVNADHSADTEPVTQLFDDFLKEKELDSEEYEASVNANITIHFDENGNCDNPQIFAALTTPIIAGATDNIIADENTLTFMASAGYIMPLSDYLTEEEIKLLEQSGDIIYADAPETKEKTAYCVRLSDELKNSVDFLAPCDAFGMSAAPPNQENSADFLRSLLKK